MNAKITHAQLNSLLNFLSEDGVMDHGKFAFVNNDANASFWKRAALQLNSIKGGVRKNPSKWSKTWSDYRQRTKKKAEAILNSRYNDSSSCKEIPKLTKAEMRILKIMDFSRLNELKVVQLQEANKVELPDSNDLTEQFLPEDYNGTFAKNEMCSEEENSNEDFSEKNLQGPGTKYQNHKPDGEPCDVYKSQKRSSLHEGLMQRNEELRLKALELKLKGDELKLKEIEMQKINHLTSLEEEKLKCFRDISTSLKELVECTRNGNLVFQMSHR